MNKLFFFILAFLLSSFTTESEKSIEFLKLKNTKIISLTTSFLEIETEAVIYNPYKLKAKVEEVRIDVFIDNQKIGTISETEQTTVKKQSTSDIPLHLRTPLATVGKKILSNGVKLLIGNNVTIEYKGYVKIKALGGMAPIKVDVTGKEHITLTLFNSK